MLSHPKGGGAPGTRGRFGGIPFKEDPNAPRPQKRRTREGGAARESKNETREKGTARSRRNALRKTRKPASDNMKRICLPLPGSPCQCRYAWREDTKDGKCTVIVPLGRFRSDWSHRSHRPHEVRISPKCSLCGSCRALVSPTPQLLRRRNVQIPRERY